MNKLSITKFKETNLIGTFWTTDNIYPILHISKYIN